MVYMYENIYIYILFRDDIFKHSENLSPDIPNLVNLTLLGCSPNCDRDSLDTTEMKNSQRNSNNSMNFRNNSSENVNSEIAEDKDGEQSSECSLNNNKASYIDNRYKGKFVSDNVVNLSGRGLSNAEISLLSKGLKFVPTTHGVNIASLKEELEIFGRRLRLMWHFRNEEKSQIYNPFQPKSQFNPKGKDVAIEMYLAKLEEEILAIDTKLKYSNLTREERKALYALQNDSSIIIKEADKGSAVVVWDKEDYLKEAEKQLNEKNVYEEIKGDCVSPLIKIIKNHLHKVQLKGDISSKTMEYFLSIIPNWGGFICFLRYINVYMMSQVDQ